MKTTTITLTNLGRILLLVTLLACTGIASTSPLTGNPPVTPSPVSTTTPSASDEPIRFAVIGDFGDSKKAELDVSNLVKSWEPDFIITVGDNNYPSGEASTIDENIGRYYHEFIHPYTGSFGAGAETNRFFPILGNHDWDTPDAQPHLDYFTLPGNERYYDFVWGPVHFFALDSDDREPDGIFSTSTQALWLKDALAASTSPWNIVYLHHAPYSSGKHGSQLQLQWPYAEWGADAVLSGHDHIYERVIQDGIPFFVNGLGGASIYSLKAAAVAGSEIRYDEDYGAMLVDASESEVNFQFINRDGLVIDTYSLGNSPGFSRTKDIVAPQTYIATNVVELSATTATFKFASSEPGTFYCRLDGKAFTKCTSPMKYTNLDGGTHEFQVYAVDAAGNADTTPAKHRWRDQGSKSLTRFRGR